MSFENVSALPTMKMFLSSCDSNVDPTIINKEPHGVVPVRTNEREDNDITLFALRRIYCRDGYIGVRFEGNEFAEQTHLTFVGSHDHHRRRYDEFRPVELLKVYLD
jgi:hypothetical protein